MKCPVCKDVDLLMSDRQGVEIDYCPNCRGVWLDRGELDKIIERSLSAAAPAGRPAERREETYRREERPRYPEQGDAYRRDARDAYPPDRPKRRESFLSDLFDFD